MLLETLLANPVAKLGIRMFCYVCLKYGPSPLVVSYSFAIHTDRDDSLYYFNFFNSCLEFFYELLFFYF